MKRCKEYFEHLMKEENRREERADAIAGNERLVREMTREELRRALGKMKRGKAVGLDGLPAEVWKCLGEVAVVFLTTVFNRIMESEKMPDEWRRITLVPIFKNKGDSQNCSNYRGIKLMSHTMKIWERIIEARIRKEVKISEQQFGFMPGRSTVDAIFDVRTVMKKYRDGQKELHGVFIDLEKVYDRVPHEELWHCMRETGVSEEYVKLVQDMCAGNVTVVLLYCEGWPPPGFSPQPPAVLYCHGYIGQRCSERVTVEQFVC